MPTPEVIEKMSSQQLEETLTNVDKAINAAKANRTKRVSDPAREAKKAAQVAEREQKRIERENRRAEKAAERANRKVHMAKVERAGSLLPTMSDRAQSLFQEITASLPRDQVSALAQHLNHFNRIHATTSAATTQLDVGTQVRITSSDSRYFGRVGTISKAQRIRCFVQLEGVEKPVYLYNSDVELVKGSVAQAV